MENCRRVLFIAVVAWGLVLSPHASLAEVPVQTLHTFSRLPSTPNGKLAVGPDGTLYGRLYECDAKASHAWRRRCALRPSAPRRRDATGIRVPAGRADGNFYLAAQETSGVSVCGGIFRVTKAGEVTKMHHFG